MIPSFEVPPQYFYALAASLPPTVSPAVRYRLATLADPVAILDVLRQAITSGTIEEDSTVTVEMAARRLGSLGTVEGITPICDSGVGLELTTKYSDYQAAPPDPDPTADIAPFWNSIIGTPPPTPLAEAHLEVVLCAITGETDSRPLINAVRAAGFTLDSVKNLDAGPWVPPPATEVTLAEWQDVFAAHPELIPASVGYGTLDEQVAAFVRQLKAFFDVSPGKFQPGPAQAGTPVLLARPLDDLLKRFFDAYRSGAHPKWEWGDGLDEADRDTAIESLKIDAPATAWLSGVVDALDEVYSLTNLPKIDAALRFTFAESLWARGFTAKSAITALSLADFAAALVGTPAHDHAKDIWVAAGGDLGASGPEQAIGEFAPINPGDLVDCVPPCELSPTGSIAYLQALLDVHAGQGTIGSLLTDRAGPLGDLAATSTNATVALPAIDLVNESLEAMVATGQHHGVVHDTNPADAGDHNPDDWFGAVPAYSSPAVPVAEPAAYKTLAADFSAATLPYDQRLDINRRHLEAMGTTRFDVLRGFRRNITEFVLDRAGEPATFPKHLWRYPVRLDIALEYLCISPVEYDKLFNNTPSGGFLATLYGFASESEGWTDTAAALPELLTRLDLQYCDLVDLLAAGYVAGHVVKVHDHPGRGEAGGAPECEPCCLPDYALAFGESGNTDPWVRLVVFVRLWHKLKCTAPLTFAELTDVCEVLGPFDDGGHVNPDFVPQLAALIMLRRLLRWTTRPISELLDLWRTREVEVPAAIADELIEGIAGMSVRRHCACTRGPEFLKLLRVNLDPLSALGGFDPTNPALTWHSRPTHTLRFAEQLSKIWASGFGIGELTYLFTAGPHLAGDDPYPLASESESQVDPLEDPDDVPGHSLWELRRELLAVDVDEETVGAYSWARIHETLTADIGGTSSADTLTALGAHLFPGVLNAVGVVVGAAERRYTVNLAGSSAPMWNTPGSPFHYDDTAGELSVTIPFDDDAVLTKLSRIRPLQDQESQAVRDLYAAPAVELAEFGYLFTNIDEAREHLIADSDEDARWEWFRSKFAMFHARCGVVARHLARHVLFLDGGDPDDSPDGDSGDPEQLAETETMAWRLLRVLLADENAAQPGPWENDAGDRPKVMWGPAPVGSAFAAITGLVGTGLLAEHTTAGSAQPMWREIQGTTALYDVVRDRWNTPAPTILPPLDAALPAVQQRWAAVRNGIGIGGHGAQVLGGITGFRSRWSGLLLVEEDGNYTFWGDNGDRHHEDESGQHWQVRLGRGQKHWILLSYRWNTDPDCFTFSDLALRRGVYDIDIELVRDAPDDDGLEDARPLHCGVAIDYRGPDTGGHRMVVPTERLYLSAKDGPLDAGVSEKQLTGGPRELLRAQYVSTLRDVRRTYQRAFKSLLLCYRFGLSARTFSDYAQSELGYLLDHGDTMAGLSFYNNGAWRRHAVDFDPNLLPLLDTYLAPTTDVRSRPSVPRQQAWFDVWERLFDHTDLRAHAETAPEDPVWLLYDEAAENQPDNPAHLLRHVGIDISHAPLVLTYTPGFAVDAAELTDERWPTRVWHADQVVRRIVEQFTIAELSEARPDLWASTDLLSSGGNRNLVQLVRTGFLDVPPERWTDLRHLNDCLRGHARDALVAYLIRLDRVPQPWPGSGFVTSADQLSDLLLGNVGTGTAARITRIDAAIAAVHTFVDRARIGLEPPWWADTAFIEHWDNRYASCEAFGAFRRSELYRENEFGQVVRQAARHTEAFRFLEAELRRITLTTPVPGGLEYWNSDGPPRHPGLTLLQGRDASQLTILAPANEGLDVLGTPIHSGQRSWLTHLTPVSPRRGGGEHAGAQADRGHSPREGIVLQEAPRHHAYEGNLPLWLEAAVRLGAHFVRVPAAGIPPAGLPFTPHDAPSGYCSEDAAPIHLDEYYFWLVDTAWFDQIEQVADWPGWHDVTSAAPLLEWAAQPGVHLMWSHVRNGEICQPHRSDGRLAVSAGASAATITLTLIGREHDSILFSVGSGRAEPGAGTVEPGAPPPPAPGFRYDLATDQATAVPLITPDEKINFDVNPALGALPAYPFFVYFTPGSTLFPTDPAAEALAVACALRTHCAFEAAIRWYTTITDPGTTDNRWCAVDTSREPRSHGSDDGTHHRILKGSDDDIHDEERTPEEPKPGQLSACCDSTATDNTTVRRRHLTLEYLETLLEWSNCTSQDRTAAGRTRTRLILDAAARILGPTPVTVKGCGVPADTNTVVRRKTRRAEPPAPTTVATFVPCAAPLNPWLMSIYERVAYRRAALAATDSYPQDNGCCACGFEDCGCESCSGPGLDCCCPASPYRFNYVLGRASDFAGQLTAFGNDLQSALEKGDAEYLAAVRARHERQVLSLSLSIRKEQWRDADWQVQSLRTAKQIAQNKYDYYDTLINRGLAAGEIDYRELENSSFAATDQASTYEAVGTTLGVIPDVFVGTMNFSQIPIGTKLANIFAGMSRISGQNAAILSGTAGLRNTESGWDRRLAEWTNQRNQADLEIAQTERQILGAERRRAAALGELNSTEQQIENAHETTIILSDKATSHPHYLQLVQETAALHRQMYAVADCAARQAERALNVELGFTHHRFVPDRGWTNLREVLTAGPRLSLALRRMDAAYTSENGREYELTKHVSLCKFFSEAFLALKVNGECTIELPEWLFDLDYPGHYMRRIKSVSLTIPAIAGPYTGVHARLTLLRNTTRIEPTLHGPTRGCCTESDRPCSCGCSAGNRNESGCSGDCARCGDGCCAPGGNAEGYDLTCGDCRSVSDFGIREAIATSSGQNDSGLFELTFRDERYLPFEYAGAVSTWKLEIPPDNNDFDLEDLADAVMHIHYTAREGGPVLRTAASTSARRHLPDEGVRLIDIAQEMPNEWARFTGERGYRQLDLRLSRDYFGYTTGSRGIRVRGLELLVKSAHAHPSTHVDVEFEIESWACCEPDVEYSFMLAGGADWCGFYHGAVGIVANPVTGHQPKLLGRFEFEQPVTATQIYLLLHYELTEREPCRSLRDTDHDNDRR